MNGRSEPREGVNSYFDVCRPHPAPSIQTRMRIKRDWTMQEKRITGCVVPTVRACHGRELKIGDVLWIFGTPQKILAFDPHPGTGEHKARVVLYGPTWEGEITLFDTDVFVDEGDGVYKPRHLVSCKGAAEAVAAIEKPDESGT